MGKYVASPTPRFCLLIPGHSWPITGTSSLDLAGLSASHLQAVQESGVTPRNTKVSVQRGQHLTSTGWMQTCVLETVADIPCTHAANLDCMYLHLPNAGQVMLSTIKISQGLFSPLHTGVILTRESL